MAGRQEELRPVHLASLRAFLAKDSVNHLHLLGLLEARGISGFWGQIEGDALEAVIFAGKDQGLLLPAAYSVEPLIELATFLSRTHRLGVGLGEASCIVALTRTFSIHSPRIERKQRLFVASPDHLGPFTHPSLRLAVESDLPQLIPLAQERVEASEPLDLDRPIERQTLEERLLHRILRKQTYVFEVKAELVFAVDVLFQSPHGAQLEGAYTIAHARRRGYATLALGQLSRQLLASLPRVTLRLPEEDVAAKGLAHKVGFVAAKPQKLVIAE